MPRIQGLPPMTAGFSVLLCAALFVQTDRMMKLKMDELILLRFINAFGRKAVAAAPVSIDGIGNFTTSREGIILPSYAERLPYLLTKT
ncbi:hypothetical protein ACYULU_09190 [Breznakiellaceae bacterium SP9]